MKKLFLFILSLIVALVLVLVLGAWLFLQTPVFGAKPGAEALKGFAQSSQFNSQTNKFENRQSTLFQEMRENFSAVSMLQEWFEDRSLRSPEKPLPFETPDLTPFLQHDEGTHIIWLGHSSFLLNLSGTTVLVDPIFSDYASPLAFVGKLFQAPVITLDQLPAIDVVLLSHDHYDHLDMQTVRFFSEKSSVFIAPLGVGAHLLRWGIKATNIIERDWWEGYSVGGVEFIAAPAQHFSGRDGIVNNGTLWASWVIQSAKSSLYFSGDSGYDIHFKTIGDRYGPFDLAFMEDGQYDTRWPGVHMFPEQAVEAALDLRASSLMPVHWGLFELAYHTWYDPIVRINEALQDTDIQLVAPLMGQTISLDKQLYTPQWWQELILSQ